MTTRSAPASLSFFSASSSLARATIVKLGPLRARGERDVEVVGVGVGRRDEPACAVESGLARDLRPPCRSPRRTGRRTRGRRRARAAVVEDDVRHAGGAELAADALADAAVPADDVVVAHTVDRPPPPPLRECTADHAAGDRLDEGGADVGKDSQPAEHDDDRPELAAGAVRRRIEAVQRPGHDRAVERSRASSRPRISLNPTVPRMRRTARGSVDPHDPAQA